MGMNDYILKFEEGCLFVPFIASNDKDRAEHFMRGLRAEIRRDVRMSKANSYKEIVEKALMAEYDEKEIDKERQFRRQKFVQKGQVSVQGGKGEHKGKGKEEYRGNVATTLIDIGATHSFIYEQFMHSLGLAPIGDIVHFSIVLPSGEYIHSSSVIRACPVQVDEELLNVDLIVILMIEFNVFFGMDWLSTYRAVIDCIAKTVRFPSGHGDSRVFMGSASMVNITREGSGNVSDIDILRDYLDVFEDDVPGLPPNIEVEFVIDIVPGTAPISKAPYRMAPTEMKELKSQLQELLDKGFIRPSSSPWEAPVLFVKKKDGKGIAVDPAKIEAVKKWPIPLTVAEVRSFLGFAGCIEPNSDLQLGSMIQKPLLLDMQRSEIALVEEDLRAKAEKKGNSEFGLNSDGLIIFQGRICVPVGDAIRRDVLMDAHTAPYSVHPGGTKMYQDLRRFYQSSIGMAPYETLYGRKYRSPLYWDEVGERKMLGLEPLEFNVGDQVFVKIAPLKGVMRFGKKCKLSPRYIVPFEILDKIGERAYRLAFLPDLDRVHNVFHVSMLRKYLSNPSHVLRHVALDLLPNLSYEEVPVQIIGRKVKVLRNKEIGFVKVLWRNHVIEDAT
ncbi:uncharacterized protein [Primulina huaijiensis]|uniref:uncharacterized protein n=1 Tax=Primulina huaijiensis TaxID=1492673 RepID=UPI003CC70C57